MNLATKSLTTSSFNFKIITVEGYLQIQLFGKLRQDYTKKFEMSLLYLINKGIDRIIIDLSSVTVVDRSNILFLLEASDSMFKSDRKLVVIYPCNESVVEALDKLRFSKKIPCFNNFHTAISHFDQKKSDTTQNAVPLMYIGMNVTIKTDQDTSYLATITKKYNSTIWLTWPKNKDMNLIFVADKIQLFFSKSCGIYQFESQVIKKMLNPSPALVIMKPAKIHQTEVRHFYRYNTKIPIQYKKFYDEKISNDKILSGVCSNLSAGGVQIESSTRYEKFDYIMIYLQLPGFPLNSMIGKIVRVMPKDTGGFRLGVKFTSIFEIVRLRIENYILEKMNFKEICK